MVTGEPLAVTKWLHAHMRMQASIGKFNATSGYTARDSMPSREKVRGSSCAATTR